MSKLRNVKKILLNVPYILSDGNRAAFFFPSSSQEPECRIYFSFFFVVVEKDRGVV